MLKALIILFLAPFCCGQNAESVRLVHRLLAPAVRVESPCNSVSGSGTIVYSQPDRGTFVITNHHVVEEALKNHGGKLRVERWNYKDGLRSNSIKEPGRVYRFDKDLDLAVVRLADRKLELPCADILPDAKAKALRVFDECYEVGCAMRAAPFPTKGMLSAFSIEFSKPGMWLSSSPTVYGDSGGSVCALVHDHWFMIAIPSYIATRDNDLPVYHMNIMIPCTVINKWLDANQMSFLRFRESE